VAHVIGAFFLVLGDKKSKNVQISIRQMVAINVSYKTYIIGSYSQNFCVLFVLKSDEIKRSVKETNGQIFSKNFHHSDGLTYPVSKFQFFLFDKLTTLEGGFV
jgi:hypothetical protein